VRRALAGVGSTNTDLHFGMTDATCLAALAGPAPSVGVALWAVYLVGPQRAIPVVDAHRPFGGDLLHWLCRFAGLPLPTPDARCVADPRARRALVAIRDARTGSAGAAERLTEARALLTSLDDALGLAFCALQLGDEHAVRGDLDAAERWGLQAEQDHGHPIVRGLARSLRSNVAVQQGLPQVAEALVLTAAADVPPGTVAAGLVAMRSVVVAQYAGRRTVDAIDTALAAFELAGAAVFAGRTRAFLARTLVVEGRCQDAVAVVRTASLAPTVPRGELWVAEGAALLGLGRLRAARDRLASALEALAPGDQNRWLAAAGELAAATWMGDPNGPGAELAATLPDVSTEDLPGTQLMLHLTRRWARGGGAGGMVERGRVLDDVELIAAAAGLRADEALAAGDLEGAARWLDDAREAADRGGYALRQLRNERLAARLAMLRGEPAVERLRGLLDRVSAAGDVLGEALASGLLAEALVLHEPAQARESVERSLALAAAWGIARGVERWVWLGALLGCPLPDEAPAGPDARVLAAGAALAHGVVEVPVGVAALDAAMGAVGGPQRAHLGRVVAAGLGRIGLDWRPGAGPTLVLRDAPRAVWLAGEAVADLGRARVQHRLLQALTSRPLGWARDALFEAVWEQPYRPPSSDNSLHVALGRLRKRLGCRLRVRVDEAGRVALETELGLLLWR
jgi:tetratricopeptide (TPR) repeat protein